MKFGPVYFLMLKTKFQNGRSSYNFFVFFGQNSCQINILLKF